MPYDGPSDSSLPASVKKMPTSMRKQWVEVFNSAMAAGDDEGAAMAKAHGAIKNKSLITDWYDVDSRQLSKEEAGYTPYGGSMEGGCASCRWYVSPDACLLVYGDISPTGKSNLWHSAESSMNVGSDIGSVDTMMEAKELNIFRKTLQKVVKALGLTETETEIEAASKEVQPILFTKTSDGALRFFTSFTNCFKDLQGEIITTQAHKSYVEWACSKEVYPELWLWHAGAKSKWGKVDWLEFSDGFVLASGIVDADKEYVAEEVQKQNVKVSHGFYGLASAINAKEIVAYRTFEVSVLPADNAANPYTSFNVAVAKENSMAFSPAKREWLKSTAHMTDEAIATWESSLASMGENLKAQGIDFKEIEGQENDIPSFVAEVANYAKATEAVVEAVKVLKSQTDTTATTVNEIKAAMEQVKALVEASDASKVEAAILAKIAQAPNGFSATQSKENIVDKEKEQKDYSWFTKAVSEVLK